MSSVYGQFLSVKVTRMECASVITKFFGEYLHKLRRFFGVCLSLSDSFLQLIESREIC